MKRQQLRAKSMTKALLSDQKNAVLMQFATEEGGQVELEVGMAQVKDMLKLLYFLAHAHGETQPNLPSLPDVPLHDVLQIPGEEIEARTTDKGGVWLLSRTGSLCTAMALPDPRAAQLLGESLLKAAAKN